jgi:hypothetical protein
MRRRLDAAGKASSRRSREPERESPGRRDPRSYPALDAGTQIPMLPRSQFTAWLQARRDAGETLTAIDDSLGVSRVTVKYWLTGQRTASRMALVLAGDLRRAPVELAPGLPTPCSH